MKKISLIMLAGIIGLTGANPAWAKISSKQAIAIAKKAAGGGVVTDVDYYRSYYEVDVQKRNKKHEIKVSTKTGKIITHQVDYDAPDYDDDRDD